MAHANDGSGRLFVLEQHGAIRIVQEGQILPEPFLDITPQVTSTGNEQGLLGLAFHPRYTENGYFYVNYTRTDGDTIIARFQVSAENPNLADPASETQLMHIPQPFANHNGGAVVFGPDGYLYLALGDGGAAGDPQGNGQSLDTLLGKILRIDVDAQDTAGRLYGIPADNPFSDGGGLPEIWAYGLRNPWRIAFDRLTGDLYFADVGQNQWEEVNYLPAGSPGGANFGWDYFEGTHSYEGQLPSGTTVVAPVAEYSHAEGGCSITGGFVYRGPSLPAFQGVYLYGDFCTGLIWGLLRSPDGGWQNALLFQNAGRITSFGEDEAGELYLLDRSGVVYILTGK
jgi:glucose/arabinose dehydrogenase